MFICGGPVYVAGVTTSAINLALIMALAPLVMLQVSFVLVQEAIHRIQIIGMLLSLAGAALIITKGQAAVGAGVAVGDLLTPLPTRFCSKVYPAQPSIAISASRSPPPRLHQRRLAPW